MKTSAHLQLKNTVDSFLRETAHEKPQIPLSEVKNFTRTRICLLWESQFFLIEPNDGCVFKLKETKCRRVRERNELTKNIDLIYSQSRSIFEITYFQTFGYELQTESKLQS